MFLSECCDLSGASIPVEILQRATKLVTPTDSEARKLGTIVAEVTRRIQTSLESVDPKPEVALGGSYARGTWLKGSHDVDFFLLYPVTFPRAKLESDAIETASRAMAGYRVDLRYAEHPYVESFVEGIRINLVPCYSVASGEWLSAADRSPYHTKYIHSKLDDRLKLEARLFKKFVKAAGVYGAEVRIQGFSGYVCEVLTLKWGSFLDVLKNLSAIKPGEIISLETFDEDLVASFKSAMVILDPVDTNRNLGSAISTANVGRLVLQSRRFLSKPSIAHFLPEKSTKKIQPKKKTRLLLPRIFIVSFKNEPRSPDILWGELKRSSSSVSDKLSRIGFHVLRSTTASDEKTRSALLFLLSENSIDCLSIRQGPDYFRAEEVEKYFEKNRSKAVLTWMDADGKVKSIFERESGLTEAENVLRWMLQKNRIKEVGLSPRVMAEISRSYKITAADRALRAHRIEDWLAKEITALSSSD